MPREDAFVARPIAGAPQRSALSARLATARLVTTAGDHLGQGLVLHQPNGCATVLTCHHVIAATVPTQLRVVLPGPVGTPGPALEAFYDATRSDPGSDAVVLSIADVAPPKARPVLHGFDATLLSDGLIDHATGYTYLQPGVFSGRPLSTASLDLQAEASEWPGAQPTHYRLAHAIRLAHATDARDGISGSVVIYDNGVIGLAHFARSHGRDVERELYVVPLSAWARLWPELEEAIEPLVDERLRASAVVRRVQDLQVGFTGLDAPEPHLLIAGYREDLYIDRPADSHAANALEAGSAVVLIGRPKSGKTRLAWELIRSRRDAVVVRPKADHPPLAFDDVGLAGRAVVLLADDLHERAEQLDLLRWLERLQAVAATVTVIATSRDGADWRRVEDGQQALLRRLDERAKVYVSRTLKGGTDASRDEALAVAARLDMADEEIWRRFDGTLGSLVLDLRDMARRYERLRDEDITNTVSGSRVVDSVKLLRAAGQTEIDESLVRAVAVDVRGGGQPTSEEAWSKLCRRTAEEGFGGFGRSGFQTYQPYLEDCVAYQPSRGDLIAVADMLRRAKSWHRLITYAATRDAEDLDTVVDVLDHVMAEGGGWAPVAAHTLGFRLSEAGKVDRALEAYAVAMDQTRAPRIASSAALHTGRLQEASGRMASARSAYEVAFALDMLDYAPAAAFSLAEIATSDEEAIRWLQAAFETGHPAWAPHVASQLTQSLEEAGRPSEAIDVLRTALAMTAHSRFAHDLMDIAGRLEEDGDAENVAAAYRAAAEASERSLAERAWMALANFHDEREEPLEAAAAFARVVDLGSAYASLAADRLSSLRSSLWPDDEDDSYDPGSQASDELGDEEDEEAVATPGEEFYARRFYETAVAFEAQGELFTAIGYYESAVSNSTGATAAKAALSLRRLRALAASDNRDDAETTYLRAKREDEAGRRAEAIELYRRVVDDPQIGVWASLRIAVLLPPEDAVPVLERAIVRHPDTAALVYFDLALNLKACGNVDDAATAYFQALVHSEDFSDEVMTSLLEYAEDLAAKGDRTRALALCRGAAATTTGDLAAQALYLADDISRRP